MIYITHHASIIGKEVDHKAKDIHIHFMTNSTEVTVTFDFQAFLQSDKLADLREYQKDRDIINTVSASISFAGSAAIVWHILRSHKGLSSTYHRLVFGLCVGDLMASLSYVINSTAVPKEMQYLMPSARGNVGTCTALGLFLTAGIAIAYSYNCKICCYYLSIITFNKNDDYIKRNLEPWFHGVPIVFAVVTGIIGLIMKQYNNNGLGGCYLTSYHPPHCRGVANGIIPEGFAIPCGRGDTESGNLFKLVGYLVPLTIVPTIIVGTMITMHRTVRKIERKMRNYGATSLRLRASRIQARVVEGPNTTLKSKLLSICPCVFRNYYTSRSNNARSQKRAVLYMAMSYSVTWALTWIPFYIVYYGISNKATGILVAMFTPLQGLYNLVVYMTPKVRNARNTKRVKLPWRQAIAKVWMSKGEKDRAIVGRRHSMTALMWQRFHIV